MKYQIRNIAAVFHLIIIIGFLAACTGDGDRMRQQLELLEDMNQADSVMTNDTLAEQLVKYFDRHGTPNERLRAHYILGRTYADMGESPRAVDAYLDAASQADTTAADCDWKTLIKIYAQMSLIYHRQNLPYDEIRAIQHYIYCARKSGDSLNYVLYQEHLIRPYYLLGEKDTVLQIIHDVNAQLQKIGSNFSPTLGLGTAVYIYTERGELDKAGQLLDILESQSELFDAENIRKNSEGHYWVKGLFKLAVNEVDSAEHYFRKAIRYGDINAVSSACKGMLSVFQRKPNLDSVVHYAHLYEVTLDSLHNQMQTDAIRQTTALYDYTRSQKLAEQEAQKKREAWYWLGLFAICVLLLACICIWYYRKRQRERQEKIRQLAIALATAKAEQRKNKEELEKLKSMNYKVLIAEREEKGKVLTQRIFDLEQENSKSVKPLLENHLDSFRNSQIVQVFAKKSHFTKEHPIPNKAEWNVLVLQFKKDMPAAYQAFNVGKKLSTLELYTCILLILGYQESIIVGLTGASSQSISLAKSRANQKLFNEKGAVTLKYNLERLLEGF